MGHRVASPTPRPGRSPMISLRLTCYAILVAALAAGCASAPAAPAASRHAPKPAAVSPHGSNAGSTTTPTGDASPTADGGAATPSDQPGPPTDAAVRLSGNRPLPAGRYYLDNRDFTNASRLTFTLPAGWTTEEYGELYKDRDEPGGVKFITWVLTHVFGDACQWGGTLVDVGTTVDELVAALSQQEGREASVPTSVTVGGFPAKRLELTVPADLDTATCTNGVLRYWPAPGPDMSDGDCCATPGSTDQVYVVDVAGNRLIVVARQEPGASEENLAELQGVVDSIEIEPYAALRNALGILTACLSRGCNRSARCGGSACESVWLTVQPDVQARRIL